MKKYNTILTHRSVHLDEICAIVLLQRFGQEKYPGVDTAIVRYVMDEPIGTDAQFDADGILPVGCGHGRFDDKTANGQRKSGVCATTLVAKDIGFDQDPRFTLLLDDVLFCDSKEKVRATQLAGIVKTINRSLGGDQMKVIDVVRDALNAILMQRAYQYAPVKDEWGAIECFKSMRNIFNNDRAYDHVMRLLDEGVPFEESCVTEFGYVLRAMQRQGKSRTEVAEWSHFAFNRMYEDQLSFQRTRELIRPNHKTHRGQCSQEIDICAGGHGDEYKLRGMIIRSDEANAHAVAGCMGYQVILCRRSSGHTQMFTSGKVPINLRHAVAMIRWLDLPSKEKGNVTWESLMAPGEHPLVPHWHYFQEAGQLFNGTQTHMGVEVSQICLDALTDVLRHAFHGALRAEWKNERNIAPDGKFFSSQNRPNNANRQPNKKAVVAPKPDLANVVVLLQEVTDELIPAEKPADMVTVVSEGEPRPGITPVADALKNVGSAVSK